MIDRKKIKLLMVEKDVKGVELAARLGLTRHGLQAFFTKKHFTQEDLQKVADALGVEYVSEFRSKD